MGFLVQAETIHQWDFSPLVAEDRKMTDKKFLNFRPNDGRGLPDFFTTKDSNRRHGLVLRPVPKPAPTLRPTEDLVPGRPEVPRPASPWTNASDRILVEKQRPSKMLSNTMVDQADKEVVVASEAYTAAEGSRQKPPRNPASSPAVPQVWRISSHVLNLNVGHSSHTDADVKKGYLVIFASSTTRQIGHGDFWWDGDRLAFVFFTKEEFAKEGAFVNQG
ncbi:hypothetical protein DFJ73DRAFT_763019 [Zopfochytrium polystomum]|nr:hypothetical protein DFJ73DRAFT_763019 [Zopfochytrium polystomum]